MTKKAVLDLNVLISALFWKGALHQVFQSLLKGEFLNFISPAMLGELKGKLLNKFRLPEQEANNFLETITFASDIVYPRQSVVVVKRDATDDKIIECAVGAGASFIVSGDKHLLEIKKFQGISMLTSREFLSIVLQK